MTVKEIILNTSTGELDVELSDNGSFRSNIGQVVTLADNGSYYANGEELVFGGGSGITTEQAVDAVASAITTGTHTGVTVAYDDAGNKINLTVTASGGSGGATNLSVTSNASTVTVSSDTGTDAVIPAATTSAAGAMTAAQVTALNGKQVNLVSGTNIKTINGSSILGSGDLAISGSAGSYVKSKKTITANSANASVLVYGYGTQAHADAITASVSTDGTTVTIAGVNAAFALQSVTVTYPDTFTTGTNFKVIFPAPAGGTDLTQVPMPDMVLFNLGYMRQTTGVVGVAYASGNVSVERTGMTAGTGMIVKAICV